MTKTELDAISRAITDAEAGTSGRIAVRVIRDASVDAFDRARYEFDRIGLSRHEHANAALILVAPRARRFAVIGDRALHERVGDEFWNEIVEETQPYFARGDVSEGIVCAVGRLGQALRMHFVQPT